MNDLEDKLESDVEYSDYLLKHKFYVLGAGMNAGLNPGRLIKHDYSKFKPSRFITYANWFFGPEGKTGTNSRKLFKDWRQDVNEHYATEAHHNDKLGIPKDVDTEIESIADWYSVYRVTRGAKGMPANNFKGWFESNRDKWIAQNKLSPNAAAKIQYNLDTNDSFLDYAVDRL